MNTIQTNSVSMLTAGIDYHKRYSIAHVIDAGGKTLRKGRIEPNSLPAFAGVFSGFERAGFHA